MRMPIWVLAALLVPIAANGEDEPKVYEPGEGGLTLPKRTQYVSPNYPHAMLTQQLTGWVILSGVVDAEGNVRDLEVFASKPAHSAFEQAAIAAVSKWRYKPGTLHGEPVAVALQVRIDFEPPKRRVSAVPRAGARRGQVVAAEQKTRVDPVYPAQALSEGLEATVRMELTIGKNGGVESVRVLRCRPKKMGFEEAALAAAKQWTFRPAHLNGEPVRSFKKIELHFRPPTNSGLAK